MKRIQEYRLKSKKIFIGLEVAKRNWKLCVRSGKMTVHEVTLPAEYENLRNYICNNYPDCEVEVIYEAGFSGFSLHDRLEDDGYNCIVTPPNKVTQAKVNRVKTDKIDARRLAINLENGDYSSCHVPDRERREDRQAGFRTNIVSEKPDDSLMLYSFSCRVSPLRSSLPRSNRGNPTHIYSI